MPQLEKGGKFVFGISVIGHGGKVKIPPAAFNEYGLSDAESAILMNGSRTSGGFVLTTKRLIGSSLLADIIYRAPGLVDYSLPEGETISYKNRQFGRTSISDAGFIVLSPKALSAYHLNIGDLLVAVRGSNTGITFIVKGPIWELAMHHPEVERF